MKKLICLVLIMFLLSGCSPSYGEKHLSQDLGGLKHDLVRIKDFVGIEGRIGGGFFLGSGGISGSVGSSTYISFAFKIKDGSILIITEPTSKIRLIYESGNPYIVLVGYTTMYFVTIRNSRSVGERVEIAVREYFIHVPKESEYDFLLFWNAPK